MKILTTSVLEILVPGMAPDQVRRWATAENNVDFHNDPTAADCCTTAFAATELVDYLSRSLAATDIRFADRISETVPFIELALVPNPGPEGFSIEPIENDQQGTATGVRITGNNRTGLLYGAYEILRLQGWRWYEPGAAGEYEPPSRTALQIPDARVEYQPSFTGGRGFDLQFPSMESADVLLWMARNRLNMASYRALSAPLARKLGFSFKNGGHIFETLLDPDRLLPSGNILWDEHRDWFGKPEEGSLKKEDAQNRQFCVSQPDMIAFLAGDIAERLRSDWTEVDYLAVWGFDTWGEVCMCPDCTRKGNASDRMVHFAGRLRDQLNRDHTDVSAKITLVSCAYEGTCTLDPPTQPVSESLVQARDRVIQYPIDRTYAYDFFDPDSPRNRRFADSLKGWLQQGEDHEVTVGEYYNVSKFEDLPLVFTERICNDIPAYRQHGATGLTYMHPPMLNWGTRALTHTLYAALAWDVESDVDAILEEFFTHRYGPHATAVRHAYDLLEDAWSHIAEWRAWHGSVLRTLLAWDGSHPDQPLDLEDSFGSVEKALEDGNRAIPLMEQALQSIETALTEERSRVEAPPAHNVSEAVNPLQARRLEERQDLYAKRLGEYRRHFTYGLHTMQLMTACLAYHHALYLGNGEADSLWSDVELVADQLDQYWVPIAYSHPRPGIYCKDGLTRTQLRQLVRNCRRHRPANGTA